VTHPRELILVWNNCPGTPTALSVVRWLTMLTDDEELVLDELSPRIRPEYLRGLPLVILPLPDPPQYGPWPLPARFSHLPKRVQDRFLSGEWQWDPGEP
jgi:hypothetical protein